MNRAIPGREQPMPGSAERNQDLTVVLAPRKVYSLLWSAIVALTALGLASQIAKYRLGTSAWLRLADLLDLDLEGSVWNWYSSATLLVCAALLSGIALARKAAGDRSTVHWAGLAVIFLAFSIDETAHIHEMTIRPLRNALNLHGALYFGWVIPGVLFVLVVLLAYARFMLRLPMQTRVLFIVAGTVFVAGALGMEMIGAHQYSHGGRLSQYVLLTTLEEILEMVGVAIFVYGLLEYLRVHVGRVSVRMSTADAADPPQPACLLHRLP